MFAPLAAGPGRAPALFRAPGLVLEHQILRRKVRGRVALGCALQHRLLLAGRLGGAGVTSNCCNNSPKRGALMGRFTTSPIAPSGECAHM